MFYFHRMKYFNFGIRHLTFVSKRFNSASNSKSTTTKKIVEWSEPNGFDSGLTIYNTINKKKVKLKTKYEGVITWYACGPTVYDSAHIGHACCYVYQDIIRRIMEDVFDLKVMMVMGITDIDDKIINASISSGKETSAISRHYEAEFLSDMAKLNVKVPSVTARVTDYIPQIVNFIDKLIKNDFGYLANDGSVYFRVDKFKGYGKLYPAETDDCAESGGEHFKESKRDFALWKGAKKCEPSWPAPWGVGRPGWHIECSAIASYYLGSEIDLHSGGVDLIFPHHENEEAQSCCYHSVKQWVNYWLHTGHLCLSGDVKMSKSLKNTISIADFLSQYSPFELRMFCLLTRYRNGIEYTDEFMKNAIAICKKFDNFFNDCDAYVNGTSNLGHIDGPLLLKNLYNTENLVNKSLADDFDTPHAISHILHLVTTTNKMLHEKNVDLVSRDVVAVAIVRDYIKQFLKLLGYSTEQQGIQNYNISNILNTSVQFRSNVRKAALSVKKNQPEGVLNLKNTLLNLCDSFREDFKRDGIELKDHGGTTSWNVNKNL